MSHKDLWIRTLVWLSSLSCSIQHCYTSIFSFGDSFSDTGNIVIMYGPRRSDLTMTKPPYGMTFFGHPNGRLSDGRLIIDFVAEALGIPLLPPSFTPNRSFEQGANFATAGATALDRAFFVANNFTVLSPFNISIGGQLGWLDDMKPSLCADGGCKGYFSSSLFVVGEFGFNDYLAVLLAGRGVDVAKSITPQVVTTICAATQKLVEGGARTVVVSGIPPMGCTSGNLVLFGSSNETDYEPDTGCLKNLNLFCA